MNAINNLQFIDCSVGAGIAAHLPANWNYANTIKGIKGIRHSKKKGHGVAYAQKKVSVSLLGVIISIFIFV